MKNTPLLQLNGLSTHFPVQKSYWEKISFRNGRLHLVNQKVHAVNQVDLTVNRGETIALVGESGCGKSTLVKTIIGLYRPTDGQIVYDNVEISRLSYAARKPYQKRIQVVFQDPYSSLNPRKKVIDIIGKPLRVHGIAKGKVLRSMVLDLMEKVGLDGSYANRYPHQFSGGQRQRIGIARALACRPELIIADEPIAALDVSVQAQILNLMMDLQEEFGLTYLFVSHDLSVVRHISDRVVVMYLGHIVEQGRTEKIFANPSHPYTQLLFSAIPTLDVLDFESRPVPEGEVPTPIDLPAGCHFHPRCPRADDRCLEGYPPIIARDTDHWVACRQAGGM